MARKQIVFAIDSSAGSVTADLSKNSAPFSLLLILAVVLSACGAHSGPPREPIRGPAIIPFTLELRDTMSDGFRLTEVRVFLDGHPVYDQSGIDRAQPQLPPQRCLLQTQVSAGTHVVRMELAFRGNGRGVFSYLNDYTFAVEAETDVTVRPGSPPVHVAATSHEQGRPGTPLEERPQIEWSQNAPGCR